MRSRSARPGRSLPRWSSALISASIPCTSCCRAGLRFVLDIAGLALLVAFFGLVAWHGWSMVAQSWASQSRSQSALQTPVVIPQFIWLLGLMVFVAIGILLLVYAVQLAARGQHAAVAKAISTRSAEEEVEDEIRDLEQRSAREGDR